MQEGNVPPANEIRSTPFFQFGGAKHIQRSLHVSHLKQNVPAGKIETASGRFLTLITGRRSELRLKRKTARELRELARMKETVSRRLSWSFS